MKKKSTILYQVNNVLVKQTTHLGSNDDWWRYTVDDVNGRDAECSVKSVSVDSPLGYSFNKTELGISNEPHRFYFEFRAGDTLYELAFDTPVLIAGKNKAELKQLLTPILEQCERYNSYEQDGTTHYFGLSYLPIRGSNYNGLSYNRRYTNFIYDLLGIDYER